MSVLSTQRSVDRAADETRRRLKVFRTSAETWIADVRATPLQRALARARVARFNTLASTAIARIRLLSDTDAASDGVAGARSDSIHDAMRELSDRVAPVLNAGDHFDGLAVGFVGTWARDFLSSFDDLVAMAGWHADPRGRFDLRYYDGARWTEHVSRGGAPAVDPY